MAAPAPPTTRPLRRTVPEPRDTDALRGRPVLVTGATGFVGRHLVRRLNREIGRAHV